jgi:type IV secretory pathway TrbD component
VARVTTEPASTTREKRWAAVAVALTAAVILFGVAVWFAHFGGPWPFGEAAILSVEAQLEDPLGERVMVDLVTDEVVTDVRPVGE